MSKEQFEHTLAGKVRLSGRGLHTGARCSVEIRPAEVGTGLVFIREDVESHPIIKASARNVVSTARGTTVAVDGYGVATVEHLLSALTGMGVDNAEIAVTGPEVPILDGSAAPFAEAVASAGLALQDAPRRIVRLRGTVSVTDPSSGSYITIEPSDEPSCTLTIDFGTPVPGVQTVSCDDGTDYRKEIAPCRTFCFFKEIEPLLKSGLIKGGSLENAVIITSDGYMGNLPLRFQDECGRHKMLDLIGDLRLCGGFLQAKVTAYKPGHSINVKAASAIIENLLK